MNPGTIPDTLNFQVYSTHPPYHCTFNNTLRLLCQTIRSQHREMRYL
jgi:hypothetical protein